MPIFAIFAFFDSPFATKLLIAFGSLFCSKLC